MTEKCNVIIFNLLPSVNIFLFIKIIKCLSFFEWFSSLVAAIIRKLDVTCMRRKIYKDPATVKVKNDPFLPPCLSRPLSLALSLTHTHSYISTHTLFWLPSESQSNLSLSASFLMAVQCNLRNSGCVERSFECIWSLSFLLSLFLFFSSAYSFYSQQFPAGPHP